MNSKSLVIIINILKNGNGALYQKHVIKILKDDVHERQVRRYLKQLEKLEYIKIEKKDNRYNILYLTQKAYKEVAGVDKRISNSCNNSILEKNFIESYLKYKYKSVFRNNIWELLYKRGLATTQNFKKIEIMDRYKNNIVIQNLYIYEHKEIAKENYITILQVIIYNHNILNKDLKKIIIVLNELIEKNINLQNNLMIDYKIYSFNNIQLKLLEKSLNKHYEVKEHKSDISNAYKIEYINLKNED